MSDKYQPWPEPADNENENETSSSSSTATYTGNGTWSSWLSSKPGQGCVIYCGIYAMLGLCLSTFGPVILDLAAQTNATLQNTGYCLIVRSLGYLAGSFAGFLYDLFPGHRLLSLAMFLAGLGTFCITLARSSLALAATVSLQGIAMGLIDTGANLLLLWLFKEKAGPPMQAMHCAFAVGATLGPFLENLVESASPPAAGSAGLVGVGAYNPAFYLIAVLCWALCVLLLFVESPPARVADAPPPQDAAAAVAAAVVVAGTAGTADAALPIKGSGLTLEGEKWRIVLVTATLLGIYVGVETGYGSYVTAYSVLYVGSSESRGQLLAGGYWAAIMVGRFASIFIASHVSASLFLRVSMLASAASALFLLLAGGSDAGLWLGSLVFGLAMACVYPTTLSLVETFFPVLGRHVTCIMIGSASGEMALPFVIATLFGNAEELSAQHSSSSGHSPQVLMWVIAVFCAINAALLYLLLAFGKQVQEKLAAAAAEQQAVVVVAAAAQPPIL